MRKLIVWNVMTLDGYFEGPTAWDLDMHGTVWGDELEAFSLEQGEEIGTLLFGRRTYEGMAAHWTQETGDIADMMNGIEKAVASRTLESADWNNTRLLSGEATESVKALKAEDGKDVFIFGSAELVGRFSRRGSSTNTASASLPWCWAQAIRCSSRAARAVISTFWRAVR
jgi:dihydrofolate reductase